MFSLAPLVFPEYLIACRGFSDFFPIKQPPIAGKKFVAGLGPAVGQEEDLGEQRRGLFVGFVGNEQVDTCVFRQHPYIDFVDVRVSQMLLDVGTYQVLASVDGE